MKIAHCIGIWGCLGAIGKQLMSRNNKVYFIIFRIKMWKIFIFYVVCCWKFKKIAKIVFGRKN
jgi:hypothetical protein